MRYLALLALLALPACAPNPNLTLTPRQQPVVSRTDHVIDLAVGYGGLRTDEQARLVAWLDALKPGYGDSIAVDDPARRVAVRDMVAAVAGERGLLLAAAAPITPGEVAPGTARVVLTRSGVTLPGCPDFSYEEMPHQASEASRNYGCASYNNLAAMIADPQDLLRGRSGNPGDAGTVVKAVSAYRRMPTTGEAGLKVEKAGSK